MIRATHQALATGIVMKVVELLLPKRFALNRFRMATRLPETALSVRDGLVAQRLLKAGRTMVGAIIAELSTGELAKIVQGSHQPLGISFRVEDDQMQMCRHDDIGVDA